MSYIKVKCSDWVAQCSLFQRSIASNGCSVDIHTKLVSLETKITETRSAVEFSSSSVLLTLILTVYTILTSQIGGEKNEKKIEKGKRVPDRQTY